MIKRLFFQSFLFEIFVVLQEAVGEERKDKEQDVEFYECFAELIDVETKAFSVEKVTPQEGYKEDAGESEGQEVA